MLTAETISVREKVRNANMVKISASGFLMGDRDGDGFPQERPVRYVEFDGYWIARYCVTVGEYHQFMTAIDSMFDELWCDFINPCFIIKDGEDFAICDNADKYPMIQVSFVGAAAYCNWRSVQEGLEPVYCFPSLDSDLRKNGYRLPLETEWEYACGGPDQLRYGFCSEFQADCFSHKDYHGKFECLRASARRIGGFGLYDYSPMPVGTLPENAFGLYEMLGNVNEWCHDYYLPYDRHQEESRPQPRNSFRAIRGGCFLDDCNKLRKSYRHGIHFQSKCMIDGFRLARNV